MAEPEEAGELVGTGGFRVAGERALEVLRSAQLDKRFWRPLLWLRLAASLGARRMEITASPTSVTATFDGEPLARALLEQPFTLFGADGERPEARWLAYALVHTATKGVAVSVTSGLRKERRGYRFDHTGHAVPAKPEGGENTVVTVEWPIVITTLSIPAQGPWLWFIPQNKAGYPRLDSADAVPFGLTTPLGAVVPWEKRKEPEAGLLRGYGRRVRVRMADGASSLTLHHHGVRVYGMPFADMALPMAVDVDDPNLSLDASLGAPVQGPDLERSVAGGLAAAVKHGLQRLEHQAKTMRLCARLLLEKPPLRRLWGLSLALPERVDRRLPWMLRAANALRGSRKPSADELRVVRTAEFTAYLRAAALKTLLGRKIDARDPLRQALWETPLLFSATGRPLTLADLDLDERPCSVWAHADPAPAGAGAMMVWGLSSSDAAFAKGFPRRKVRMG